MIILPVVLTGSLYREVQRGGMIGSTAVMRSRRKNDIRPDRERRTLRQKIIKELRILQKLPGSIR